MSAVTSSETDRPPCDGGLQLGVLDVELRPALRLAAIPAVQIRQQTRAGQPHEQQCRAWDHGQSPWGALGSRRLEHVLDASDEEIHDGG